VYIYIYSIPLFRRGTQGFHKNPPSHSILGITFNLCPGLLTPLAFSGTVLCHVFLGLSLPHLPWRFHSRACLAVSSDGFHSVWPSHPHLHFLICKSILGWFVLPQCSIRYLVRPESSQYFP
jgi:hypothetical protein